MNLPLFPEMERDIRDGRKAEHRERIQRAREYLRGRNLDWLINYLLEKGPTTEHAAMMDAMDEEYHFKDASREAMTVLYDLYALWLVKKLWRKQLGAHPQSNEMSYLYGVRGVHKPFHDLLSDE